MMRSRSSRVRRSLMRLAQFLFQDLMVDGRKVLHHIHLQSVGVLLRPYLVAIHRRMCPLIPSAGIGVGDEGSVQWGLHDVHHSMVHDAIPKGRRRNDPRLAFVDGKEAVGAGPILSCFQLPA